MNYDVGIDDAIHTVRLTLGQWEYRGTWETEIYGNVKGGELLPYAIDRFVDHVMETLHDSGKGDVEQGVYTYVFTSPDGSTLSGEIFGSEMECEYEARRLVLGVEIIDFKADEEEIERKRLARLKRRAEAVAAELELLGSLPKDPTE